jgi:hemolysin III
VVQAQNTVSAQLIGMWVGAGLGMAFTLLWTDAPRGLRTAVYVLLGASSAPVVFALPERIGSSSVALVVLGGVLYLVGGVVYALRRPNPWPRVLGYHELFHLLVVLAAGAHFAVVARLQGLLSA